MNRFRQMFSTDRLWLRLSVVLTLLTQTAGASDLDRSIRLQMEAQQASVASQDRVDALDDETREMLAEYRHLNRELKDLHSFNDQLERNISSQEEEIVQLKRQLAELEITKREIVPLMLRMLDTLERLVSLDLPFLEEERSARIRHLKTTMDRADKNIGEKFRLLLEAYRIEADYGRTLEAYQARLANDDRQRVVDFLRLGRLMLYYRTLDGREAGAWQQAEQRWQSLNDRQRHDLARAMKIARKRLPPDLMPLLVPAPGVVQ